MKKPLLAVLFWMAFFTLQAQITRDTTYNASVTLAKLETSGYKYYTYDWLLSQCRIYNTDHSIWKTIPLVIPTDQYLYSIQYLSETLFNPDSKVELAYTFYSYDTLKLYYTYTTRLINEDGSELLLVPGAAYVDVIKADTLGTKMLVYAYDYSVNPYTVETIIYTLPGNSAPNGQNDFIPVMKSGSPFPNPTRSVVTVPYILPDGLKEGQIDVTDISGKMIRSYRIDNIFHDLKLDVAGYGKGVYIYRITAGGVAVGRGKFVVE